MRQIAVLGSLTVVGDDGAARPVRSDRQRLLLALLASRLGHVVPATELAEALWGGGELPDRPLAALQSQVFRLRHQAGLGDWVVTEGVGYRLACDRTQVDAARFRDLMAAAGPLAEPQAAVAVYDEALALWRGRAYLEVAEHDALQAEAVQLEQLRAQAAEARAQLLLGLGRASEAAVAMEALAANHPFRERPVELRMRALAADGRYAEALRTFDAFRRLLGQELGLDPSPDLGALQSAILGHRVVPRPAIGLPGNSFVGRESDLAAVTKLLAEVRLVTLTGPGGAGKTRLAMHAAVGVADRFADGVHLCELAKVGDAAAVAPAIASALRVDAVAGRTVAERLVDFLRPRQALLVLDNCEHVLPGVAGIVEEVSRHAPGVQVLATSRRRLGAEGEHVVAVGPLSLSGDGNGASPAVTLFNERAAAWRRAPAGGADPESVRELCRRLDGLPLAIELAAARTAARTPAEILHDVAGRLDHLADPRRAQERHRSIDAVVGWSYDQLDDAERAAFLQTSVFRGGFTARAVAAVMDADATAVEELVWSLVDHSLLAAADAGGTMRFSVLEPVRQFAAARLAASGGREGACGAHAAWAAAWVADADRGLRGSDEAWWASAITAELDNLRAAHRWSLEHDRQVAVDIAAGLYWYGYWHGTSEVFDWAAQSVTDAGDPALQAGAVGGAHATAALGAWRRGDGPGARRLAERGLELAPAGDLSVRFAAEALASVAIVAGEYEGALTCLGRAAEVARAAGDPAQVARELAARALVLGYLARAEEAGAALDAAKSIARTSGNPTALAFCDYVAGEVLVDRDPALALPYLRRARDAGRRTGNAYLAAIAGLSSASCAARVGDPAGALEQFGELLDYFDRAGSRTQQWTAVRALVEILTLMGWDDSAAVLHGALIRSATAPPLLGADADRVAAAAAGLRARLGAGAFDRLSGEGQALGDDGGIAYALRVTRTPAGADISPGRSGPRARRR